MTDIEKGGRPLQLDETTKTVFYNALKDGLTIKLACDLVGISRSTYTGWEKKGRQWQDEGEKDSSPLVVYGKFIQAIDKAKAEFAHKNIQKIGKVKKDGGKSAQWLLEKALPDEYSGGNQKITVTHEDKKVYQITWGDEKPKLNDGLTIEGEIINGE